MACVATAKTNGTPLIGTCCAPNTPCGLLRWRKLYAGQYASCFTGRPILYPVQDIRLCNANTAEHAYGPGSQWWLQMEISYAGGSCDKPPLSPGGLRIRDVARFAKINRWTGLYEYFQLIQPGSTVRNDVYAPYTVVGPGGGAEGVQEIGSETWNPLSGASNGPATTMTDGYSPLAVLPKAADLLGRGTIDMESMPGGAEPYQQWQAWEDSNGTLQVTKNGCGPAGGTHGAAPPQWRVGLVQIEQTEGISPWNPETLEYDWQKIEIPTPAPGEAVAFSAGLCHQACNSVTFFHVARIKGDAALPLRVESYGARGVVWVKGPWCMKRTLI